MRVKAREDLPHREGTIPKDTEGTVINRFDLPTGGACLVVDWEQGDGGPGTTRNAMPGEYEVLAE